MEDAIPCKEWRPLSAPLWAERRSAMDIITQVQFGLALAKLFALATCATFCLAITGGIVATLAIAITAGVSHDR